MSVLMDPFDFFARANDELRGLTRYQRPGLDAFKPRVEVKRQDDDVLVALELPGVDPKDVDISFEPGRLTVTGERRQENVDAGRSEFFYGSFRREFTLPQGVSAEDVSATNEHGVLKILIRNAASTERSAVKIEVGSPPEQLEGSSE